MGTITITPASGWVPLTGSLSAFITNTDKIKAEATATVQPFVRLSGPAGATATLLHRCATAEGQTS